MSSDLPSFSPTRPPSGWRLASDPAQSGQSAPLERGLYVVSTPIGNLRDVTLRALDVLAGVEEILAEDTRISRKLLDAYGIQTRLTSYHDHNGAVRRPELLSRLAGGAALALISDAGTPLVSDPGYKLVREAAEAGHAVRPIPGASALLAGLVVAGLPSDRFLFCGFLPPKSTARRSALEALAAIEATLVFYEAGRRLAPALADMANVLGGSREVCLARELTKRFEEVRRGRLADAATLLGGEAPPKGELVVLIGPPDGPAVSSEDIDAALGRLLPEVATKDAARQVAAALGLPKRAVYQRALALKSDEPS